MTGCAPVRIALLLVASVWVCRAQLITGVLHGRLHDGQAGVAVTIAGKPASRATAPSDANGEFEFVLPYGEYRLTAENSSATVTVYVRPLQVTQADVGTPSSNRDTLAGMLLALNPATVTDPLDFAGLSSMRLPVFSHRALSWTATRFTLQGANATDAYQPGRMGTFPDLLSPSDVVLRSGLDLAASPSYGAEIAMFAPEPGGAWHGRLSTGNAPASQGWFTRNSLQTGGPLGRRADLLLSTTGQWTSQAVPQALNSRLLAGSARGRVQLSARDQLDVQGSQSRIRLSDWGTPAGLEALAGRRMSPSFAMPAGLAGLRETDRFDSIQTGWTRQIAGSGALEVRYGFSRAHLDTTPTDPADAQSRIDLEAGVTGNTPPLANLASRSRHGLQTAFEPALAGRRHRLAVGGGWELAKVRNRWSAPFDVNLITARGVPAFVVELNTPRHSRSRIQTWSAYVRDEIKIAPWLGADLGLAGDFARGSSGAAIAWNSASPRLGLVLSPPFLPRLTLRGSYARTYAPLAGRYLDFGDPASLGGGQFQWTDRNADGIWQRSETGPLRMRFGGPYSTIDRSLRRPYADEFNIGAEVALPLRIHARLGLFRRDEKRRLAAVNIGVPAQAFSPVEILDPDFENQKLTVYAQDPATFGKDQYLLTNPPGLRMFNQGLVAELGGRWRSLNMHTSFMAVKSRGPANPGSGPIENDSGVLGALFQDPNTAIHASGRTYFDRAYVGKAQLMATLPKALGGVEVANTAVYLDGLVFGRRLLVTGLPQGPFCVSATVRGSPEGGHRAEYVLNWNLRLSRTLPVGRGSVGLGLEVLNVPNLQNKMQEVDASGPLFSQRLPVAIQMPRFVRVTIEFRF